MQILIALTSPARRGPAPLVSAVRRWAVASQRVARRNAMLASTECADRRAVRLDVDTFLRTRLAPRAEAGLTAHG